jgi:hypothetical protein
MGANSPNWASCFLVSGCFVLLQGCAPKERTHPNLDQVQYSITTRDVPEAKAFEVTLLSRDDRALCLFLEQWPGPIGQVSEGADYVSVVHSEGRIPIKDINLGFCYGGCGAKRVEPGGQIQARIPYEQFGPVDEIASLQSKRLDYAPRVFTCTLFETPAEQK